MKLLLSSRAFIQMNQPQKKAKPAFGIDAGEDVHATCQGAGADESSFLGGEAQRIQSSHTYSYDPGNLLLASANLMMNEEPLFDSGSLELQQTSTNSSHHASAANEAHMNLLQSRPPTARHQVQREQYPWMPLSNAHLLDQYKNEQHVVAEQDKSWLSDTIIDAYKSTFLLNSDIKPLPPDKTETTSATTSLRPLNAYNYFFRDERDNLVYGERGADGSLPPPIHDFSDTRKRMLLNKHWFEDPVKGKRKHRKQEGIDAIPFTTLSREIAERWRQLPVEGIEFYRQVAREDKRRHEEALRQAGISPDDIPKKKRKRKEDHNLGGAAGP